MADVFDDLRQRAVADVFFDVRGIQAIEQFGLQRVGFGADGVALDVVFDLADDLTPCGLASGDRVVEMLRHQDATANTER